MKEKTLPKYLQLKQEILSWIISGQMKPDEKIPTEHEIANQFQLSRHTVRQALGELEKEGWLYKIQGSGTFVSRPKPKEQVDTKTIGIVTTYISDYIFPHIVRGAEETLREKGYRLLLASTNNDKQREKEQLEQMIREPLSGLIIEPTKSAQGNPNLGYYLSLNNLHIPYVMINARYLEVSCPCVKMDDEQGGFLLTDHLIRLGIAELPVSLKLTICKGWIVCAALFVPISNTRRLWRRSIFFPTQQRRNGQSRLRWRESFCSGRKRSARQPLCATTMSWRFCFLKLFANKGYRFPMTFRLLGLMIRRLRQRRR
ncbi:Arabinose metabolism transcriptional repressor [Geobacillus sp. BCO2]|nr:Arabinose metabolism transcriptional repressor [Geobacillus sp. BCO2]